MSRLFEADCRPLAPFDLPYPTWQDHRQAQQRHLNGLLVWPTGTSEPAWALSAGGFPGLRDMASGCIDPEALQAESAALQLAFLRGELEPAALALVQQQVRPGTKICDQCRALIVPLYGPLSLGLTLSVANQPLWQTPQHRELLLEHLRLRAAWLEHTLGELVPAVMVCWIEPFWAAQHDPFNPVSAAETRQILVEAGLSMQLPQGLAPSGDCDWAELLQTPLRLLVCQPEQRAALLACGPLLNDYLEQGGIIAWALVPSGLPDPAPTAAELVDVWDELLKQALEQDVLTSRMLGGSLITIAAGLAQDTANHAERALALLAETAQLIRLRYKLS